MGVTKTIGLIDIRMQILRKIYSLGLMPFGIRTLSVLTTRFFVAGIQATNIPRIIKVADVLISLSSKILPTKGKHGKKF